MNKKMCVAGLLVATALIVGSVVLVHRSTEAGNYYNGRGVSNTEKTMYDYGKSSQDLDKDTNTFTEERLNKAAEIISSNSDKTKEEAKDSLEENTKRTSALSKAAEKAGYSVTEKEVIAEIKKTKEAIHSNEEAEKELQAYLAGADKSEDEYWELVKQDYEKNLLIEKYVTAQIKKKAKENGVSEGSDQYYEKQQQWQTEIENEAMEEFGDE